jgi:hypothetical protein
MGLESVARLEVDSKRYALAMRKFQIETLRRELPEAGYVVSVLRDFPFAAMGLIDFQGNPKWDAKAWDDYLGSTEKDFSTTAEEVIPGLF